MSPGHSCIIVRRFLALQEVWLWEPSLFRYVLRFTPSALLMASRLSHFSLAFFLVFPVFFVKRRQTGRAGKFLR